MKVPLFLGFGDILMLKIKSQKRQLWGFGDQRGMTQITWDQVRWVILVLSNSCCTFEI